MRYRIEGTDPNIGKPAQVEMDADTPELARHWATEHGILVSSVRPLDIPPRLPVQTIPYATPAPSRGVRTGLAMAYVGASGLFTAVVGLATWLFWRDSRGTPLVPTLGEPARLRLADTSFRDLGLHEDSSLPDRPIDRGSDGTFGPAPARIPTDSFSHPDLLAQDDNPNIATIVGRIAARTTTTSTRVHPG